MALALTRNMAPETPYLMAANLACARRRRFRPGAKDWLRSAHRLVAGLSPRAAALPEGGDESLVERLLAREEFRAVVDCSVEDLAASPARRWSGHCFSTMRRWRFSSSRRRPATAIQPPPWPMAS